MAIRIEQEKKNIAKLNDRALNSHMSKLRKKQNQLEKIPNLSNTIHNKEHTMIQKLIQIVGKEMKLRQGFKRTVI